MQRQCCDISIATMTFLGVGIENFFIDAFYCLESILPD
jgi:hypothetical protein